MNPTEENVLGIVCLNSPLCLDVFEVFCLNHLVPETGEIVPEKRLPVPVRHCLRLRKREKKEN